MAVSVVLYKTKSDNREVDKKLTKLVQIDKGVRIKESGSMFNLSLTMSYTDTIDKNIKDINYLYVNKFKRYYFIEDIELVPEGVRFKCHVDVLMSFKDGIRSCKAFIRRQENRKNYNIIDDKLIYNQRHIINRRVISTQGFTITLTCNGGNG